MSSAQSIVPPEVDRRPSSWVLQTNTNDIRSIYEMGAQLGQPGQFGRALLVTDKKTGEKRAVKEISKGKFSRAADKKLHFDELRTEIEILRRLDHKNIIKLHDVFETKTELYLVMELCAGGELFDRIKSQGSYNEKDAAFVLRQITEGLAYLHKNNVAHCDLKPDNFLFSTQSKDSPVKIIDFGMSKFVKRRHYFHSLRGTPYYIAPEVIQGHYSYHCDMWSLGVVMFVMLFGYPAFHADNDDEIFRLILRGFEPVVKKGYKAHFPADIPCSDSAKDLIAKLLTKDTAKRLTAEEALMHPWLTGETASTTPLVSSVYENLKNFSANNKFKRDVLNLMCNSLSEDELKKLRETFKALDENGDGSITVAELQKGFAKAGTSMTQQELEELMRHADIDGDGSISYQELMLASVQKKLSAKEERLWVAFCKVDLDHDGKVTAAEIEKVLGADYDSAKAMIAEVDTNGDGTIDFDEFITLFMRSEHSAAAQQAVNATAAVAVSVAINK